MIDADPLGIADIGSILEPETKKRRTKKLPTILNLNSITINLKCAV